VPPPPAVAALPDKVILDGMVLKGLDGSWKLEPEGLKAIQDAVAKARAAVPGFTVVVSGHTSSTGTRAYNLAVSKRRAAFVAKALAKAGVPAGRITVRGLGPDHPLADNGTREGRLKNQRVEVEFLHP
jgi:OOP family OmpA-OmpF porin